jgi:hypothetical protein
MDAVFWNVTLYSPVEIQQCSESGRLLPHFGGTCCLYSQGTSNVSNERKLEGTTFDKTVIHTVTATRTSNLVLLLMVSQLFGRVGVGNGELLRTV